MKLMILGGENYTDQQALSNLLNELDRDDQIMRIIETNRGGKASVIALVWALKQPDKRAPVTFEIYYDWESMKKEAKPDIIIKFPDAEIDPVSFPNARLIFWQRESDQNPMVLKNHFTKEFKRSSTGINYRIGLIHGRLILRIRDRKFPSSTRDRIQAINAIHLGFKLRCDDAACAAFPADELYEFFAPNPLFEQAG